MLKLGLCDQPPPRIMSDGTPIAKPRAPCGADLAGPNHGKPLGWRIIRRELRDGLKPDAMPLAGPAGGTCHPSTRSFLSGANLREAEVGRLKVTEGVTFG
jgi:hypothetical protein